MLGLIPAWSQKLDSNWVPLFNGKDLKNWYSYVAPSGAAIKRYEDPALDPAGTFKLADGIISHTVVPGAKLTNGFLGTDTAYSRYQFRVEYKFGATCAVDVDPKYCKNSGLLYHMVKDGIWGTGIECNLYWDWPTATASLGGVVFAQERRDFGNFQAAADSMNKYTTDGQWNTMEIRVWGDSAAQHFVNGHLGGWVVGIKAPDGSKLVKGHVALQIEGNDVSFRNAMIRDLDRRVDILGCTKKEAPNFDPKATKDDGSCPTTGIRKGTADNHRLASERRPATGRRTEMWTGNAPGAREIRADGRTAPAREIAGSP